MDDKQKARQNAYLKFGESHDLRTIPPKKFDAIFDAGWDAGLAHAQQWVEIKSGDDLPKEDGQYLFRVGKTGCYATDYVNGGSNPVFLVNFYSHWAPIPPFTPKETK